MELVRRWLPRVFRWPVVLAWMALIFAGSSVPNEFAPSGPTLPLDKVAHFGEYGVLAFLLAGATRRYAGGRLTPLLLAACVAVCMAYGASDEFHQRFVPGRDASLDDLAADAVGSVAGALAAVVVLRRIDRDDADGQQGAADLSP
ncbi:MAG: VanZ family protein [Chloroflexota bacterium]|nr:VanZ family protein [Chloroflexota bacterium]